LNDVDVDLDSGEDVFLGRNRVLLASHDALSVEDQVERKHQPDQAAVNCIEDWPVRLPEDEGDDAEDDDADEHAVEVDAPSGEVVLGLESEEGEGEAEGGGDAHGDPQPLDVVESGDGAQHEGQGAGEQGQGDDVGRELAAQGGAADDGDVGHQEDHVAHDVHGQASIRVAAVEVSDGRSVGEESDDSGGEQELCHDDDVHLLDEGLADLGVGEGLAEAVHLDDGGPGGRVGVLDVVVDVKGVAPLLGVPHRIFIRRGGHLVRRIRNGSSLFFFFFFFDRNRKQDSTFLSD